MKFIFGFASLQCIHMSSAHSLIWFMALYMRSCDAVYLKIEYVILLENIHCWYYVNSIKVMFTVLIINLPTFRSRVQFLLSTKKNPKCQNFWLNKKLVESTISVSSTTVCHSTTTWTNTFHHLVVCFRSFRLYFPARLSFQSHSLRQFIQINMS